MKTFVLCCLAAALLLTSNKLPAAAPQADAQFDVFEFRVLGNSVLDTETIERAVYPFLGTGRTLAIVEEARQGLEQAYRAAGYATVYVDVPEQTVEEGIVRLQVTEGRLRRVSVEGTRYFSNRRILKGLPAGTAGTVPEIPELQAQLARANATTADLQITPVLGPGPVPGTVDLKLKVDDTLPLHFSVELNDRYTADTTRLRATAAISYDNLFGRLDSVGLQYQTSPQETSALDVLAASYTTRLGTDSDRLSFLFVNSDSNVAALGTLAVLGKGQIYTTRWSHTFANNAQTTQTLIAGVDYKDFRETILLDADNDLQTPISYVNFALGHSSAWRSPRLQWQLSNTLNFGPRGLGNSVQEFADKRFKGRPNYIFLRSEGGLRWRLPLGLSLRVAAAGQYAVDPLIANEQFPMGGADGVRGYLEAEEIADTGLRGSLEVGAPALKLPWGDSVIEGFVFADAGRVSTLEPLPGEARNADLRSWGAGFSFALLEHISGQFLWAYPLVDGSHTKSGDSRIHFSLRSAW
jgi:hemolysin activation/secretion protein